VTDLDPTLAAFIGKTVQTTRVVKTKTLDLPGDRGPTTFTIKEFIPASAASDPTRPDLHDLYTETTLRALQDTANALGLHIRVWFPGMMGTCDYRTDRLNVYFTEKDPEDGVFTISELALG
jgi:hypothetical protein